MCNLKLYSVNDGRDTPDEEEYEEEEEEEGDNEVGILLSLSRLIIKSNDPVPGRRDGGTV